MIVLCWFYGKKNKFLINFIDAIIIWISIIFFSIENIEATSFDVDVSMWTNFRWNKDKVFFLIMYHVFLLKKLLLGIELLPNCYRVSIVYLEQSHKVYMTRIFNEENSKNENLLTELRNMKTLNPIWTGYKKFIFINLVFILFPSNVALLKRISWLAGQ